MGAQRFPPADVSSLVTTSPLPRLELRLTHLRNLSLADYPALAEQTVPLKNARLTLRVIGASSLVLIETAAFSLVELIACGVPAAPALACTSVSGGPGASSAVTVTLGEFSYSATLWTARFGSAQPDADYPHQLEFPFPGPHAPLTRIEAGERDGAIHLRTRHDYPEAGTVVWSESTLRVLR